MGDEGLAEEEVKESRRSKLPPYGLLSSSFHMVSVFSAPTGWIVESQGWKHVGALAEAGLSTLGQAARGWGSQGGAWRCRAGVSQLQSADLQPCKGSTELFVSGCTPCRFFLCKATGAISVKWICCCQNEFTRWDQACLSATHVPPENDDAVAHWPMLGLM